MNSPAISQLESFPQSLSTMLCCPWCQNELAERGDGVCCAACGRVFPSIDGLLRFVEKEHYAGSFGYQWHKHPRARWGEESDRTFQRKTGFLPIEMKGKVVLDVGCGNGRFVDVASRAGARVVGVDLSAAAEVAAHNLATRPDTKIFQADVFRLPFRPASFDYIYSIGVLHHTPDCEKAFKVLVPLLKPGGKIAIWVYSGYNRFYRMSDQYRKLTTRLSPRWVHAFCQLAGPLYYADRGLRLLPFVGRPLAGILRALLPMNHGDPNWKTRVLATLDWYSPRYQSKHTYEEVFRWFEGAGLEDLHVLEVPVAVRGTKPRVAPKEQVVA